MAQAIVFLTWVRKCLLRFSLWTPTSLPDAFVILSLSSDNCREKTWKYVMDTSLLYLKICHGDFFAAPENMSWTLLCCTWKYVMDTSLLYLKICHGHFFAVPENMSWGLLCCTLKYVTTTSLQTVFNLFPISSRYSLFELTTVHWLGSASCSSSQRKRIFFFQKFSWPALGPT
jgi:hypothetical protein